MERTILPTVLVGATAAYQGQQAYDLVDVASIEAELELTGSGKTALIKKWITQASAAAAKFCDCVFPIETVQDLIFPAHDFPAAPIAIGGEEPLLLSRRPLAVQTSLAGTAPPLAPTLSTAGGGSIAGTFFARASYVTPTGETAASLESTLIVGSGLLQVASPATDTTAIATGWNCYVGTASSAETRQNAAPIALGAPFLLPASGLIKGSALPSYVLAVENGIPLAEGSDFLVNAAAGELIRLNGYGRPRRWPGSTITVQYPAGFDFADPRFADAQDGVTRMVKGRYFDQLQNPRLRSETIAGAYEAQYWFASGPGAAVGNLTPDVEALLEKYRSPVVG